MAKAKLNKQEVVKTVLIKPRESFKNEVLERILIGEELYNRVTLTADQLHEEQKGRLVVFPHRPKKPFPAF